jgi:acetyltransferase-like isoleucine patch superfamily enzyme
MPTRTQFKNALYVVLGGGGIIFRLIPQPIFRILWRLLDIFDSRVGSALRYALICKRLGACGVNVYFGPFIYIDYPRCVCIGSNSSVQHGVTMLSLGGIEIGDQVSIAHGTSIVSGEHTWDNASASIRDNPVKLFPVRIGADSWIGCGVRILAGAEIGTHSVVAAGAVVKGTHEPNSILVGIPARKIRSI